MYYLVPFLCIACVPQSTISIDVALQAQDGEGNVFLEKAPTEIDGLRCGVDIGRVPIGLISFEIELFNNTTDQVLFSVISSLELDEASFNGETSDVALEFDYEPEGGYPILFPEQTLLTCTFNLEALEIEEPQSSTLIFE